MKLVVRLGAGDAGYEVDYRQLVVSTVGEVLATAGDGIIGRSPTRAGVGPFLQLNGPLCR